MDAPAATVPGQLPPPPRLVHAGRAPSTWSYRDLGPRGECKPGRQEREQPSTVCDELGVRAFRHELGGPRPIPDQRVLEEIDIFSVEPPEIDRGARGGRNWVEEAGKCEE